MSLLQKSDGGKLPDVIGLVEIVDRVDTESVIIVIKYIFERIGCSLGA